MVVLEDRLLSLRDSDFPLPTPSDFLPLLFLDRDRRFFFRFLLGSESDEEEDEEEEDEEELLDLAIRSDA